MTGLEPAEIPPRKRYLELALSLLVAGCFVWFLRAGALPILPARSAFAELRWWTVGAHAALYVLALYLRAVRWSWLLAPLEHVPQRKVLQVSFVGYAALLLLPFRTGELVRPVMISRRTKISVWAASGTIAAERIIEGLFLALVLLAGLQFAVRPERASESVGELALPASTIEKAAWVAAIGFFVALVGVAIFYAQRRLARRLVERLFGLVSPRFGVRVANAIDKLAMGLSSLPRLKETSLVCAATLAYYLLNALALQVLVWGSGIESITFAQACVVIGVLHLGVLLPNAPGYFGAYQLSVYAGLALYFSADAVVGPGSATVFLIYVVQVGLAIGLGGAAFLWERRDSRRELDDTKMEPSTPARS